MPILCWWVGVKFETYIQCGRLPAIAFSIDPQSGNKMKRVFHAPCFMLASDIAPTSDMMRTLVLAT